MVKRFLFCAVYLPLAFCALVAMEIYGLFGRKDKGALYKGRKIRL